jgi:hypothetical protein
MKWTSISILSFAVGATCASTASLADNLLGFYLGAAAGESHVRTSQEILGDTNYDYEFDATHSAWKATVGFRPISPLGVEFSYIDFGNPRSGSTIYGFGGLTQTDANAWTLVALGYLPLPVPYLDVYGKLGIARLYTKTTEVGPVPVGALALPGAACPSSGCQTSGLASAFNISDTSTDVAYGVGVQGKLGALAIRAEYERIGASGGNPDLISLGVTWTF